MPLGVFSVHILAQCVWYSHARVRTHKLLIGRGRGWGDSHARVRAHIRHLGSKNTLRPPYFYFIQKMLEC